MTVINAEGLRAALAGDFSRKTIDVNTKDLRQALQSVLPHVATDEAYGSLTRVHVNVTDTNLYVQATNTASATLAIASVWESEGLTGDPNEDSFELAAETAKELLTLFKPSKKSPEDDIGDALRITITPKELRFLDVSGLFPGKTFTVPNAEPDRSYPNLPKLMLHALAAEVSVPARIVTNGKLLQLFAHAAAAYKQPLTIEPTEMTSRMLISCGESFLGILLPIKAEDGSEIANDLYQWRTAWYDRLPELSSSGSLDIFNERARDFRAND